mmetsp:Transcript_4532/g.17347  ORF Transcript_4532/g.17347 Transcript_4532/m.17347 type:complete len:249 (+) Transcript_4532:818-1564(+)
MTTAKLMNNDTESAIPDSTILYLYAILRLFSPKLNPRLNTRALCKNKLCGITTAPTRDTAIYSALLPGNRGNTIPATTEDAFASTNVTSAKKHNDITPTSAAMNASNFRTPNDCNPKNTIVDIDVSTTPTHVGIPNINFSANAVPMTSGTSLAMIASSVIAHSAYRVGSGYSSRMHRARSHPVASASRIVRPCMYHPPSVAQSNTQSNLYPNSVPACKSLSKFPGSTYAMHIKNPGPMNRHSVFRLNR